MCKFATNEWSWQICSRKLRVASSTRRCSMMPSIDRSVSQSVQVCSHWCSCKCICCQWRCMEPPSQYVQSFNISLRYSDSVRKIAQIFISSSFTVTIWILRSPPHSALHWSIHGPSQLLFNTILLLLYFSLKTSFWVFLSCAPTSITIVQACFRDSATS